jgi:hypothetical protein
MREENIDHVYNSTLSGKDRKPTYDDLMQLERAEMTAREDRDAAQAEFETAIHAAQSHPHPRQVETERLAASEAARRWQEAAEKLRTARARLIAERGY